MLPKGLDRRVWNLAIARAVNTAGLSLVMAFLGVYIVETRGYAAVVYGAIAVVANLAQSASNAWAGALSDRIGRRPLITGSLYVRAAVIATLGALVLADAPLWALGIVIVASSALRGCFEPVAYALVADVVEPARRIDAFGVQRMGTNLGWALGPAIGGTLSLAVPYGAIFFVAAIGLALAGYITHSVEDPVRRRAARTTAEPTPLESERSGGAVVAVAPPLAHRVARAFADRELRLLLLGTFLGAMLTTQMYSTFAIFMTDYVGTTKAEVGLLYTLNGGMVLLFQLPATAIIRKVGVRAILPRAALVCAAGFALISLSSLPGAALAIFVITFAEILYSPAHQATVAELSKPGARGSTFGLLGFAQLTGIAFAPLLGGAMLDAIGHHGATLWLSMAAVLGLGQAFCLWRFCRAGTPVCAAGG